MWPWDLFLFKINILDNITLSDLKNMISNETLIELGDIRITSNGKIPVDNISFRDLKKTTLIFLNFLKVYYSWMFIKQYYKLR